MPWGQYRAATGRVSCLQLFDEKYRAKFPSATAHFERCVALSEFRRVMGQVALCQQPLKHGGGLGALAADEQEILVLPSKFSKAPSAFAGLLLHIN